MRRMRSGCCARAASGHAAAVLPRSVMNSRRRMCSPEAKDHALSERRKLVLCDSNVRFGSLTDICIAIAMSALPPKADMCSATRDVRFVPIADIASQRPLLQISSR